MRFQCPNQRTKLNYWESKDEVKITDDSTSESTVEPTAETTDKNPTMLLLIAKDSIPLEYLTKVGHGFRIVD